MVYATQLSSYLYCPRKLFIGNVLLVEEPPKAELVKGKIWHETHEAINNAQERIVTSITRNDHGQILDEYRKNYSMILRNIIIRNKTALKAFDISMIGLFKDYWQSLEEEANEHASNVSKFISEHDVYGKQLWEKLTPKILSEQRFKSKKLNLAGVIDVLEMHDIDGKRSYVPIELKTGKYPDSGMWEGHKIQLGAYMLLLEDAGMTATEAAIKYRGIDKRLMQMNTFLKTEVLDLIRKTDKILKSLELPDYTDNKNKCKACPFREKCYDEDAMAKLLADAKTRLK